MIAISFAPHIGVDGNLRWTNAGKEGPVQGSSESVKIAFLAVPGAVADALLVRSLVYACMTYETLALGPSKLLSDIYAYKSEVVW